MLVKLPLKFTCFYIALYIQSNQNQGVVDDTFKLNPFT